MVLKWRCSHVLYFLSYPKHVHFKCFFFVVGASTLRKCTFLHHMVSTWLLGIFEWLQLIALIKIAGNLKYSICSGLIRLSSCVSSRVGLFCGIKLGLLCWEGLSKESKDFASQYRLNSIYLEWGKRYKLRMCFQLTVWNIGFQFQIRVCHRNISLKFFFWGGGQKF